jgi:hypothetical protein
MEGRHCSRGMKVKPSALAIQQRIVRSDAKGEIISHYPIANCVTVKWDHKLSRDRLHVNFLEPVNLYRLHVNFLEPVNL